MRGKRKSGVIRLRFCALLLFCALSIACARQQPVASGGLWRVHASRVRLVGPCARPVALHTVTNKRLSLCSGFF